MKTVAFRTLCGVLLFQVCAAADNNAKSSSSSEESVKDDTLIEKEFTIINECTMIPSTMNDLIADYINVTPQNGDDVLGQAKLKLQILGQEIATMRERVNKHTELFEDTDPNVKSLQDEIFFILEKVESLGDKLYRSVENSVKLGDTESVGVKISRIENEVEPTISALERICIAETQDILKNVFDFNQEN